MPHGLIEAPFLFLNSRGWPVRGEVRRQTGGGSRRIVVICHGFKGFKDWGFFPYVARALAKRGLTAVTFNFSGSGIGEEPTEFTEVDKFEDNSFSLEIEDLTQVLNLALGRGLPALEDRYETGPALLGHSRGGLDALVVAARSTAVERVVSWAGIGSLKRRFDDETRSTWRRLGYLEVLNSRTGQVFKVSQRALEDLERHEREYDPLSVVPALRVPLLLVHGAEDTTIPLQEARELAGHADPELARLVEIAGGGHTFGAVHPFTETTPALEAALKVTEDFLGE
jgi:pimeloyl-ACP methyl ester carboxylesterase